MKDKRRVYIKEICTEDLSDNIMAWFDDKYLMQYYTNSKKTITKSELISSIEKGRLEGNVFTYGIFFKKNNELIGTIKLGPINMFHKTSDLVVLIGNRKYLGKGLAVEAIICGNELAFEKFDIRKLYGGMYISNIPSIKAYTRAGWLIEGRLKGQFLVDGINEDRVLVACYNPKYFNKKELKDIRKNENRYYKY